MPSHNCAIGLIRRALCGHAFSVLFFVHGVGVRVQLFWKKENANAIQLVSRSGWRSWYTVHPAADLISARAFHGASGPAQFISFLLAGVGQIFVSCCFGTVAHRFAVAARKLKTWASHSWTARHDSVAFSEDLSNTCLQEMRVGPPFGPSF